VRAGAAVGVLAVGAAAAAFLVRGGGGEAVDVPADGMAAVGDRLLVVGGSDDAQLAAFSLPDGRLTEGSPGGPTGVVAVAADDRSTWALNEDGVHRLGAGGVGQAQPIDGWPVAVEVDEDRVWLLDVVDEDLVLGSFDVDGGPEALEETVGPAVDDGERAWRGALAVDRGEVWVTDGHRTLARRLPDDEELEQPVLVDGDVVDLAIDGRFVWAGTSDGRLLRIDRTSLEVTDVQVSRAAVVEVVAGGGHVWTADEEGVVRRVAGDDRGATAATLDAGRKVLALAEDGAVLYVANAETGVVDQVDAATGQFDPDASIDLTDALG
jgi:hypothetical protein